MDLIMQVEPWRYATTKRGWVYPERPMFPGIKHREHVVDRVPRVAGENGADRLIVRLQHVVLPQVGRSQEIEG